MPTPKASTAPARSAVVGDVAASGVVGSGGFSPAALKDLVLHNPGGFDQVGSRPGPAGSRAGWGERRC
jgi:hypothetical protein